MEEVKTNVLYEERDLLHKQLELLAEQSKGSCSKENLALLSEQMVNLYRALNDKHLQHNSY